MLFKLDALAKNRQLRSLISNNNKLTPTFTQRSRDRATAHFLHATVPRSTEQWEEFVPTEVGVADFRPTRYQSAIFARGISELLLLPPNPQIIGVVTTSNRITHNGRKNNQLNFIYNNNERHIKILPGHHSE